MQFAIAPQSLTLPDGQTLHFRVNPADTSIVELHVSGKSSDGDEGTYVFSFNRGGGQRDVAFLARPERTGGRPFERLPEGAHRDELAARQDAADRQIPLNPDPSHPLADFKSVDEDAVRGDPRQMKRSPVSPNPTEKLVGVTKTDPVHGRITGVGMDNVAAKPPEGRPEDNPPNPARPAA